MGVRKLKVAGSFIDRLLNDGMAGDWEPVDRPGDLHFLEARIDLSLGPDAATIEVLLASKSWPETPAVTLADAPLWVPQFRRISKPAPDLPAGDPAA